MPLETNVRRESPSFGEGDLAFAGDGLNPLVEAYLNDQCSHSAALNKSIHRSDEMLSFGAEIMHGHFDKSLVQYFETGWNNVLGMRRLAEWRFGSFDGVGQMLDFASGYGRATRFLVHELSPSRLTVSDIYAEAMEFQAAQFGVRAVASSMDPEQFDPGETFDFITVISLFTHLPRELFEGWLRRMERLLNPGGMLMFSVHDNSLLAYEGQLPEDLVFRESSESRSLDPQKYGSTWVSEEYVGRAIADSMSDASYTRIPGGLSNFQDVYVVVKEKDVDFGGLSFDAGPHGYLDFCLNDDDGRQRLMGWAVNWSAGHDVHSVQVLLNGKLACEATSLFPRHDVVEVLKDPTRLLSGWECSYQRPPLRSDSFDILLVKAISTSGRETVLFLDTVAAALLKSVRGGQRGMSDEELAVRAELKACRTLIEETKAENDRLTSTVSSMEASRFWKLRNRWFGVKARLGLRF